MAALAFHIKMYIKCFKKQNKTLKLCIQSIVTTQQIAGDACQAVHECLRWSVQWYATVELVPLSEGLSKEHIFKNRVVCLFFPFYFYF